MDEKSCKNILIYYIGYVTIKESFVPYFQIRKYSEEINGNKYLTLISTNSGKEKIKKCEEL